MKTCSCGIKYLSIPNWAKLGGDGNLYGWYWNCICRSTLFLPWEKYKEAGGS